MWNSYVAMKQKQRHGRIPRVGNGIAFIATRLSLIPSAKSHTCTVVITQGCDPTIAAINGHVTKYPIIELTKEKFVDTHGAVDSYAGGFLNGLIDGVPLDRC